MVSEKKGTSKVCSNEVTKKVNFFAYFSTKNKRKLLDLVCKEEVTRFEEVN